MDRPGPRVCKGQATRLEIVTTTRGRLQGKYLLPWAASGRPSYFLTSDWIRDAMASRSFGLRVITSTVSSPAIVPMTSPQPA